MTDKQTAKQRRQAQNRAARQALAARRAAATRAAAAPEARPRGGAEKPKTRRGGRAAAGRSGAGRAEDRPEVGTRRSDPARSGPSRPEPRSRLGRLHATVTAEPGGRAVLLGFLLAVALSIGLPFIPLIQRPILPYVARQVIEATGAPGPAPEERFESLTVASTASPLVIIFLLVPVAVAASALFASGRPNRVRTLTVAAVSQVLFVFLAGVFGLFYVFSAGCLGFGAWQACKAASARATAPGDDEDELDDDEPEPDELDEDDDELDEDEPDDELDDIEAELDDDEDELDDDEPEADDDVGGRPARP